MKIELSKEDLYKIYNRGPAVWTDKLHWYAVDCIEEKYNLDVDYLDSKTKDEIFFLAIKGLMELELLEFEAPIELHSKGFIRNQKTGAWDISSDEIIEYFKKHMPIGIFDTSDLVEYLVGNYCPSICQIYTNDIPSPIKLNIEFSDEELLKIRDDNYKGFLFTIYDDSIKLIANKNKIKVCDINNDRLKKEIFLTALKRMLDLELVVLYPPKVLEAKEELNKDDYKKYVWDLNNDEMINYLKENMPNNPWHKDYKNTKGVYWFGDYCPVLGWVDEGYIHYATNQGIMYVEFLKENKTGTIDIDFSDEELNNISMSLYDKDIYAMYIKTRRYVALKNKISLWDELLDDKTSFEAFCNVLKKFSEKGLIEFFEVPDKIKEELFYGSKNYSKEESLNMIKSWKVDVDKVICDIKEKEILNKFKTIHPIVIWHKKEYK
ncbi:hypothetical protein [Campylobacter sp. MG1]|uniref:hypothetical protein n=1 Tax=Campylobacter sp. MG1 TaxID=2976332 RepID=UPI00226CBCED|nr:hypothetical protein [Campylobacter sp. MG1]